MAMASAKGKVVERTVQEKMEETQREWLKKAEQIRRDLGLDSNPNNRALIAAQRAISAEYGKLFGRKGMNPLLHIKDGKQAPRYLVDRDEMWALYKPPIWQMGGIESTWMKRIQTLRKDKSTKRDAQKELLDSDASECIQEWHGITMGTWYTDADENMNVPLAEKPYESVKEFGFVQRLDLETDGPVIVGKTWRSQRVFHAQMQEHLVGKAYMCLVHGKVENKIHHLNLRFVDLGGDEGTALMIQHDLEHDPFYEFTGQNGQWSTLVGGHRRVIRKAETFLKPIAYYHRKEDNTDYSLVYVNILTGITHQIRITLQSMGHPLVSDDRYLPKEQAMSDIAWCPRNFLCEVRSDFFDLFGPHEDAPRRKYTRMSLENPLPKLFQNILSNKLTLVEKLDPTADLYQGCQYWALGDEQLMAKYPKDAAYRKKVMRWGQRRGIHLDALDRLLLLDKDQIEHILNKYKPPDKDCDHWVCPQCMKYHAKDEKFPSSYDDRCDRGEEFKDRIFDKVCTGKRKTDLGFKPPKGWFDFLADPTFHFLMIVQKMWLNARREILRVERPSWERPRPEPEGTRCTDDILLSLEAALVLDTRKGGWGIHESKLREIPGLEKIRLPLGQPPPDSNISRTRLPGQGELSQWTFTLKAHLRLTHTEKFTCERKKKQLSGPLPLEDGKLPAKSLPSEEEALMQKRKQEKEAHERAREAQMREDRVKAEKALKKQAEEAVISNAWVKMDSATGSHYYLNKATGDTKSSAPPDYVEAKVEAKDPVLEPPKPKPTPKLVTWKRVESKSQPGQFYYFNSSTGANEVAPPVVDLPWKLCESSRRPGQFYYTHVETEEIVVDPPPSARPAPPKPAAAKRPAPPAGSEPPAKRAAVAEEQLPEGWTKKESGTHKGKFYYFHAKSGKTSWTKPNGWVKMQSSSNPGKFYYMNSITNETRWTQPTDYKE